MAALIIIVHLIVCFSLIAIVLLQTGKGADMGAVFGGAGNQTLFGNTGASTFLGKATAAAAIIFMLTSVSLAYISKSGDESVVSNVPAASEQTQTLPATEGTSPGQAPATQPETQPAAQQDGEQAAKQAESDSQSSPAPAPQPAPDSQ